MRSEYMKDNYNFCKSVFKNATLTVEAYTSVWIELINYQAKSRCVFVRKEKENEG